MTDDKQIGQIFKDALKDFEQEPSGKVWKALENSSVVKQAAWKMFVHSKMFIYGISGLAAAGLITYFGFFYESKPVKDEIPTQSSRPKVELQQTEEDVVEITPVTGAEEQINKTTTDPVEKTESEQVPVTVSDNTVQQQKQTKPLPESDNVTKKEEKPVIMTQYEKTNPVGSEENEQAVNPVSERNVVNQDSRNNQTQSLATLSSPSVEFCPEQSICKGEKVTLWASGGAQYYWSNGSVNDTIVVTPSNTTVYAVTVTTVDEDQYIGNVKVTVINCMPLYVPNAFTPNGDGRNDIFKVFGSGIEKFEIQIYSRGGDRIFQSVSMEEGWDGTIKGELAPVGVYMYVIRYTDIKQRTNELSGPITLIR